MACMAINYNVMVSLDISVGNPTWPNLDVLSYVLAYAPPFSENISERKRQRRHQCTLQPVLTFVPEAEAKPTMRATCTQLSLRIRSHRMSLSFPTDIVRGWHEEWRKQRVRERGQSARAAQLLQKCGKKEEGTNRRNLRVGGVVWQSEKERRREIPTKLAY